MLNATEADVALPLQLSMPGEAVEASDGHVLVNGTLGQLAGTAEGRLDISLDIDLLGLPLDERSYMSVRHGAGCVLPTDWPAGSSGSCLKWTHAA